MSRIRVKIPKKLLNKYEKQIKKTIRESSKEAAKIILNDIKTGKDPATGKAYKALQPSTIKRRKQLAKYNKTSPEYSPRRSNLTFTGEFLKSFRSKIIKKAGGFVVSIFTKGKHRGYINKSGKRSKRVENEKILEGQQGMGRNPLAISQKTERKILRLTKRILRKYLR